MISSHLRGVFVVFLSLASFTAAQSGYTNYSLTDTGDPDSAVYDTDDTPANVSTTFPPPDVFLNASVHVTEIDILVQNLTAKINLQASVLSLLQFNAGVDVSIDQVSLTIKEVNAQVLLEARLANLVLMIDDVLNSLDLNPVLATLGQDVGQILNTTAGAVGGITNSTGLKPRSFVLADNILFSKNDYSGKTHTNRVLAQNGSLVDEFLDNDGNAHGSQVVGSYLTEMTPNGIEMTVTRNGVQVREVEYVYAPFVGLSVVSAIFLDASGAVVGTQVLSESSAGGSSTVDGEL
jgi:hypothetical protein